MVNLKALPGFSGYQGMQAVLDAAVFDATALEKGGVDGILVENTFSYPRSMEIGPELISSMGIITHEIVKLVKIPVGIVVVMEPGDISSLGIAVTSGAQFIRAFCYNEAIVTSFGIYQGNPSRLSRYRQFLTAQNIAIFGDIHLKNSIPIGPRSLEQSAIDAVHSDIDALIVTGAATGSAPSIEVAMRVKKVAGSTPVMLGSGVSPENAHLLMKNVDGAIIGSAFKKDGIYENPIDVVRVELLMQEIHKSR